MQKTLNFFVYLTVFATFFTQTLVAQKVSNTENSLVKLEKEQILTSVNHSNSNQITPLSPPDICMVGVDSNNHAYVIWKATANPAIKDILVYRQNNSNGKYQKIATINAGALPEFIDLKSNADKTSFNYRLAIRDKNGKISHLNNMHSTIHLTAVAGPNGSFQLHWSNYSGFTVNTYRIYRGRNLSKMTMIAQVSATSTNYTDFTPPSGDFYYQIEVLNPNKCNPAGSSKGKTNYLTSRSNHARCTGLAVSNLDAAFNARINNLNWPIVVDFNDQSLGTPTSWYWEFGDGSTSTNPNPQHAYNAAGLYTIKLKVCNGTVCDSIIKQNLVEVLSADLYNAQQQTSVQLYPNPSNGNFTLKIEQSSGDKLHVQIMNSTGAIVYSENLGSGNSYLRNISLEHLAKGIYFLRLQNTRQIIQVKKIVIR
jgi:PKD repeat protein